MAGKTPAEPSGEEAPGFDELLLDGPAAPPTANGEVVFEAPWQGRVFGMARLLSEQGHYSWDEFRAHLIEQIGTWDRTARADEEYRYYDHFLAALQALLAEKGLLDGAALEARTAEYALRPHGHDHVHTHAGDEGHSHGH